MKTLLLLFILCFPKAEPTHKFYVSHIQMRMNQKSNALQITLKVFTDDFEKALEKHCGKKLFLFSQKEDPQSNKLIFGYLEKTLKIDIPGEKFVRLMLGKEQEADVTWIYLELDEIDTPPQTLDISCSLLTEVFEEQQNIIDIELGSIKKTEILTGRNKTLQIKK